MNQTYFSSKHNLEEVISNQLKAAKTSIKVAVAWFTNPALFNCLLERQQAGLSVEVIVTDDKINFTHVDFQKLIDAGGTVYVYRNALMHHKFCLIDGRITINGSYNWTKKAQQNIENIAWTNDPKTCDAFSEEFESVKEKAERLPNIAATEFNENKNYDIENENEWNDNNADITENNDDTNIANNQDAAYYEGDDVDYEENIDDIRILYFQKDYDEALRLCDIVYDTFVKTTNLSSLFLLMSEIYWRKKNVIQQIDYAQKAIDCNHQNYPAYNMLGNGYSTQGKNQLSIEQYDICVNNESEEYVYYYNRGLAKDSISKYPNANFPDKMRKAFEDEARNDLKKAIECANKVEDDSIGYNLLCCRGQANLILGRIESAKKDYERAEIIYKDTPKDERDTHILKDIKDGLKDIKKLEGRVIKSY